MKVLVTGSAGFIGYHVCKRLLESGNFVYGVDNYNPYYDVEYKKQRTMDLYRYVHFRFGQKSICEPGSLRTIFEEGSSIAEPFDCVIHLAAQAGVRYSIENPHAYIQANLVGFFNVMKLSYEYNCRLVYASSSSVYGKETDILVEQSRIESPLSLYGATKICNEVIAKSYRNMFDMKSIGIRFATVYGPWGRPDSAIWLWTDAISKGVPVKLFNNGNMKRNFTYIDDIVDGIIAAIDAPDDIEKLNLGNSTSVNIEEVVDLIAQHFPKEPKKEYLPMQLGDIQEIALDSTLAKDRLGIEPRVPIKEGIKNFVEWYKEFFSEE